MNIEVLGILATILLVISFSLSGEKAIRSVNMLGGILFLIYGIIIGAFSVWLLNAILITINTYKLIKLNTNKSNKK